MTWISVALSYVQQVLRSWRVASLRSPTSPVWTSLTTVKTLYTWNVVWWCRDVVPLSRFCWFCVASGLDMDLITLLVWLAKNRSIRHLSMGKNFNNIKSKWVTNWPADCKPHLQEVSFSYKTGIDWLWLVFGADTASTWSLVKPWMIWLQLWLSTRQTPEPAWLLYIRSRDPVGSWFLLTWGPAGSVRAHEP